MKKNPIPQPELEFFTLLNPDFGQEDQIKAESDSKKEGQV